MKQKSLQWLGWGLLMGLVLALATGGSAHAADGVARYFVGGSCPFTLFTTSNDSYFMYSYAEELSPPPECGNIVQIGINQTVNWIADRSPLQNTTFAPGDWGYTFDWAITMSPEALGLSSIACYKYAISPGIFDSSGNFALLGTSLSGPFPPSPLNGTLQGIINLPSFTVPEGSRFGVSFLFGGRVGCPPALLSITTGNTVRLSATESVPPYPLSLFGAVPTFTQWGLLLMSILIAMVGVWAARKRAKAQS